MQTSLWVCSGPERPVIEPLFHQTSEKADSHIPHPTHQPYSFLIYAWFTAVRIILHPCQIVVLEGFFSYVYEQGSSVVSPPEYSFLFLFPLLDSSTPNSSRLEPPLSKFDTTMNGDLHPQRPSLSSQETAACHVGPTVRVSVTHGLNQYDLAVPPQFSIGKRPLSSCFLPTC